MSLPRIHAHEDVRPLSEFRANAAGMIRRLRQKRRALVLTQRGRGAAVLVDPAEYAGMVEELHTLRDVLRAVRELDAGKGVPHAEAKRRVLARLRK